MCCLWIQTVHLFSLSHSHISTYLHTCAISLPCPLCLLLLGEAQHILLETEERGWLLALATAAEKRAWLLAIRRAISKQRGNTRVSLKSFIKHGLVCVSVCVWVMLDMKEGEIERKELCHCCSHLSLYFQDPTDDDEHDQPVCFTGIGSAVHSGRRSIANIYIYIYILAVPHIESHANILSCSKWNILYLIYIYIYIPSICPNGRISLLDFSGPSHGCTTHPRILRSSLRSAHSKMLWISSSVPK